MGRLGHAGLRGSNSRRNTVVVSAPTGAFLFAAVQWHRGTGAGQGRAFCTYLLAIYTHIFITIYIKKYRPYPPLPAARPRPTRLYAGAAPPTAPPLPPQFHDPTPLQWPLLLPIICAGTAFALGAPVPTLRPYSPRAPPLYWLLITFQSASLSCLTRSPLLFLASHSHRFQKEVSTGWNGSRPNMSR